MSCRHQTGQPRIGSLLEHLKMAFFMTRSGRCQRERPSEVAARWAVRPGFAKYEGGAGSPAQTDTEIRTEMRR
jgi:hypothetical protein